jgi:hypothetical protein
MSKGLRSPSIPACISYIGSNIWEWRPDYESIAVDPGGLDLAPGGFDVLMFALNVPMCVERTNYMCETCLMQHNWSDVGEYLDRAMFVFQVT